jgi:hypothetical protein
MGAMRRGLAVAGLVLAHFVVALLAGCAECAVAQAPLAVTTVQDTVYSASGGPASGTVLVSWAGFTTASGAVVPAGTMSVTIGTNGLLSIALAPNAGATPIGSYYTATFHLSDGTTSREFWVVPATVAGGGPVRLAGIQNQVLPTSVAMQTVSKTYVDMAIAAALTGHPADVSSVYVLKAGDTMTGPLVLPGDPVSPNQAADKNYVDEAATTVHATSGTLDGVVIGATTPAAASLLQTHVVGGNQLQFDVHSTSVYFGNFLNPSGCQAGFSYPGTVLFSINICTNGASTKNNTLDDGSGNATFSGSVTAPSQMGPATAPSGACAVNGAWVLSQDGHATFCASGSWVTKI